MSEFLMPKLGADMTEGKLVVWHKQPGDRVRRGDIVAEVDTDKGVIDIEIFSDGVMQSLVAQPGDTVSVGAVLAIVADEGGQGAVTAAATPTSPAPTAPSVSPRVVLAEPPETPGARQHERVTASPAARRLARELEVDLSQVRGTGPSGAITREDIQRAGAVLAAQPAPIVPAAAQPASAPSPAERAARMRQTIAAAMSRSNREIPHYYLATTIDMHRAIEWLTQANERRSTAERVLYGVLLIKAVALALRELPEFNSIWDGERVIPGSGIHVGVAVSLREGGLIAPAIHNTDQQCLDALMQKLRDLVQRVRSGSLRSSELSDPTITVTNLGEQGIESVFGVIYPPQVAIVGFGKIIQRPWVVDGQVVARPLLTASLSADHRVSDGHRGALFLAAIDRLLQEPEKL